jgi:phage baseplate assembly protein gpV
MAAPNLQDTILKNVKRWVFENMHTTLPAKVLEVGKFESGQLITVQPVLDKMDSDGIVTQLPSVTCPIQYPSGGGGIISFPIAVGDTVSLQFSMMSLRRKFSYTDAIAIPGLYTVQSNLSPNPLDVEVKFNGSSLKLQSDESGKGVDITTDADVTITATGNVVVNCTEATINASTSVTVDTPIATFTTDVQVDGALVVTGTSTASDHLSGGKSGLSHVHGGVTSGGSSTAPPT